MFYVLYCIMFLISANKRFHSFIHSFIHSYIYPIIGHKIQTQYTTSTTFFRITLVEYGLIHTSI